MNARFIGCPEFGCTSPSEIVSEEMWPSTEGGVIMARIFGACGHNFLMPAMKLDIHELLSITAPTGGPSPLRQEHVSNRRPSPREL